MLRPQWWWLLPAMVVWSGAGPYTPGLTLEAPPQALPHQLELTPSVASVRADVATGDRVRALRTAVRYVDAAPLGRERTAARLLIGMLHREAGRHNLASESFTRARQAGGPLAEWAAYYEAEQDMARGRIEVAIGECARYRRAYRTGHHADDCLRLIALGQAQLGQVDAARASAEAYDKRNRLGPISEQVELTLARALVEAGRPGDAVPILQDLAVIHGAPLTGRVAELALAELAGEGHASARVPTDVESQMSRARSLRDAKRLDEAWELFVELAARASDDPVLTDFVEEEAERFGWRTRQWDFLAHWYRDKYAATGESKYAWSRYRVLFRGGRHAEAVDYALEMQRKHAGDRHWRSSHEDVGRTMLLAGRYADARSQFERAGQSRYARRARFYAAFSILMSGDAALAARRLGQIAKNERGWEVEGRYWRARALDALGKGDLADIERDWILEHEPYSWYGTWIRLERQPSTRARSGAWPGVSFAPEPPSVTRTFGQGTGTALQIPVFAPHRPAPRTARTSLPMQAWPYPTAHRPDTLGELVVAPSGRFPPQTPLRGHLWDDQTARETLAKFAHRYGRYYPELRAINDLATVGLYDLSGPLMSAWYEQWRRDYRRRRRTARRIRSVTADTWRDLFLAARDHHHVSRTLYGTWEELDAPEQADEALRLGYPLAHAPVVWESAHAHGVDPFLVLGLMRQESNYRANAVSRVGARGAMQIMPTTGHLLADLTHDVQFTAGDLHDPTLSVDYGIRYMGLLLERFEGVFPLAVASYNGGPFNVSSWLAGPARDLPMDALVEHIPFRETRDYVKRVTAWYATYVALYGPDDASVVIPASVLGDHAEVVDF